MSAELVTGIAELTTITEQGVLHDAALVIADGRIAWIGPAAHAPAADSRTDLAGRAVLPGWVDAHTHLVFGGDRSAEFAARMAGGAYAAGGIASTVSATREATTEDLLRRAQELRAEAEAQGTTWVEAKTGYGLDVEHERRTAEVAAVVADEVTFLGAHLVPPGTSMRDYVDLVTGPMLAAVAPLCTAVDVFCERGAFDEEAAREVLAAGARAGLRAKVHANQLGPGPGVRLGVELGALSVDHCNHLDDADVDAIAGSTTVATLLPAADLCTRQPLAPARRLLDAGVTVALATNCNPGSSFTTSMPFAVATAVLQMGMSVEEAVRAATLGGATALGRHEGHDGLGTVAVGRRADLHALDAPSAAHLAYRPGVPLTHAVWRRGVRVR
ncbi:imidazolonepropionase [Motilibacter rhizosphaerae]|uniref:Imidazolonepropionase n=1 Tax=Motilibacter rhizosphaerae TaxID=598652 RepID=A0A4Q7NUK7_9ACTN|nr:imidazolonepropionase [Motilibacter rhizosphaerae]RZS90883.1 imidazolonepropionase [Motilibacter rhizosphaerae]